MGDFQMWLFNTLRSTTLVSSFMHSRWGWPTCETLHFLGLSLLVGTIGVFDLRLLGIGTRIPIAALHRMVPWALLGFGVNMVTGSMFLATEPGQYIFNPSFQFKMLFLALAGLNAGAFYLNAFRRVTALGPGEDTPVAAKVAGAASLTLWIGVIVCGRMLTFFRPGFCHGPTAFVLTCFPGK